MIKFNLPAFDQYLFDPMKSKLLCAHSYNDGEPRQFLHYLDCYDGMRPVYRHIKSLLQATADFRSRLTLDEPFVSMRHQDATAALLTKYLEDMAVAFRVAESSLPSYQTDAGDYLLFSSAIQYCLQNVRQCMLNLRQVFDPAYHQHWQGSVLQEVLREHGIHI